MGLVITAKGFNEEIYDSGYGGFTRFRIAVAKSYNEEFGKLYEKWIYCCSSFTEKLSSEEIKRMNELSNDNLDILLQHSDCDGKLTPTECKKIYSVTKDLKCDFPQYNYATSLNKNQLEVFNRALYHCWKRRVNMYFH